MTTDNNTLYWVGSLVFAKVKGHPYWPAEIKEIIKDDKTLKYNVTFFGDNTTAVIKQSDICLYSEYKQIHGKPKIDNFKNKKFNEALEVAEAASTNMHSTKHHMNSSANTFLNEAELDLNNTHRENSSFVVLDLDVKLKNVHSKVKEHEDQVETDLETSLTLAAEVGNLLLVENTRLKYDVEILNSRKSALEAKLAEMEAKLEDLTNTEDKYVNKIEALHEKLQEALTQTVKEKQYRQELQNLYEEHDTRQALLFDEQTKKILDLENTILNLNRKKPSTPDNNQLDLIIYKNAETQTACLAPPPSCSPTRSLEFVLLEKRLVSLEHSVKLLGCQQNLQNSAGNPQALEETKSQGTPSTTKRAANYNSTTSTSRKVHSNTKNQFSVSLQVAKSQQAPTTLTRKLCTQAEVMKGNQNNSKNTQPDLVTTQKTHKILVEAQVHHPYSP